MFPEGGDKDNCSFFSFLSSGKYSMVKYRIVFPDSSEEDNCYLFFFHFYVQESSEQ